MGWCIFYHVGLLVGPYFFFQINTEKPMAAKACSLSLFPFFFFFFLGLNPQHMKVPSSGIESELQLLAYTTPTATQDPSLVCNLHHRSWQCPILNPLSESRNRTHNLMVPSQISFHCAMMGTPKGCSLVPNPQTTTASIWLKTWSYHSSQTQLVQLH